MSADEPEFEYSGKKKGGFHSDIYRLIRDNFLSRRNGTEFFVQDSLPLSSGGSLICRVWDRCGKLSRQEILL